MNCNHIELDCLQAKSKSRQENYFSLLAKSRSGPARDISVDFGSSTGLMSRQASARCPVHTDPVFHHNYSNGSVTWRLAASVSRMCEHFAGQEGVGPRGLFSTCRRQRGHQVLPTSGQLLCPALMHHVVSVNPHVMSDVRTLNRRDFCYDFDPGERIGIVGELAALVFLCHLCTSSRLRMAGHQGGSLHTTPAFYWICSNRRPQWCRQVHAAEPHRGVAAGGGRRAVSRGHNCARQLHAAPSGHARARLHRRLAQVSASRPASSPACLAVAMRQEVPAGLRHSAGPA